MPDEIVHLTPYTPNNPPPPAHLEQVHQLHPGELTIVGTHVVPFESRK